MDILNQLRAQAEQVEVVDIHDESTTVGFQSNKLKSSQVEETRGIAVRVVKDGRLGFAASSDTTPAALAKLVTNVLESAVYGDRVPIVFPAAQTAPQVRTYDPAIGQLSIPRLVAMGQEIIELILAVEPEARVGVDLQRGVARFTVRNQTGAEVSFQRSPLAVGVQLSRIQGDDVLIMFDMLGTTVWEDDYLAPARRLAERLGMARRIASVQSGKMPVLFSPGGALALGIPLMEGLNGKNVYTGVSPLAGKVGQRLLDEKVTIVDDGTLDGRLGSAAYDDEGVPHRRNVLVERGALKGFIYDLKTAAQSGVESTGNASRDLFSAPHPAPTNLIFQAGSTPLAEMIAGVDHGLLVDDLLGLGQGNVVSGAFSNPVGLGFKIENGEIVGRVKDVSIAGNVYEVLREVAAISRETLWVYNTLSLPYILLPGMNVVAKA